MHLTFIQTFLWVIGAFLSLIIPFGMWGYGDEHGNDRVYVLGISLLILSLLFWISVFIYNSPWNRG